MRSGLKAIHRIGVVIAFFHYKRDAEEDILQHFKEIIDRPKTFPLFLGKRTGINEQKQSGRKIDEEGNADPEFFGVIDENNGRVPHLVI
jgi:hypothetical protein